MTTIPAVKPYRAYRSDDGLWAVYELDADQPYTDPKEFTYTRDEAFDFTTEDKAKATAGRLNRWYS